MPYTLEELERAAYILGNGPLTGAYARAIDGDAERLADAESEGYSHGFEDGQEAADDEAYREGFFAGVEAAAEAASKVRP